MARYIFVTGGVVSSLGKGLSSASLAYLLKSQGFKVRLRKMDPYLNVDPGTMSPFQHGEVFVTDDGAETDLDLGHYERFSNISAKKELQTSREKKTIVCKRTSYSRDPKFTKNVINAYENKCAICNVQLGIIEAAHIIPHALPQSSNKVDNGIALCRNHHKLYDNGLIIIDLDQKISINKNVKDFLDQANLLNGFEKLESEISKGYSVPDDRKLQPSRENIIFGKKYRLSQ